MFSVKADLLKMTTQTTVQLRKAYEPIYDKLLTFKELEKTPQCFEVSKVTVCLHYTDVNWNPPECFRAKLSLALKLGEGQELTLMEPQKIWFGDEKAC
jgi:hypothetical protein